MEMSWFMESMISAMNFLTFRAQMNDVSKRMGDLRTMPQADGMWARAIAGQSEYKNIHKVHAANFDELGKFLKEEKLPFLIKEGALTEEQLEKGMTEKEAVKKGLIRRDTLWVTAVDTLLGKGYDVDGMRYVPSVPGEKIEFAMDTATLKSSSGYEVKVFVCEVPFSSYLRDMDPQLLYNLNDKATKQGRYAGLRVGSLDEINNNAGNWEN